jgi:hypothetical protein
MSIRDPLDRANGDPDSLRTIITQMEGLIRRAFADGHRLGNQEAVDRMLKAAAGGTDPRLPILSTAHVESSTPHHAHDDMRRSPPRVGLVDAPRQYPYGAVIGMLREALLHGQGVGISVDGMITYCRSRGIDVTPNVVRETIKRLRGGEEIERRDGSYFPGPRLAGYTPSLDVGTDDLLNEMRGK